MQHSYWEIATLGKAGFLGFLLFIQARNIRETATMYI